MPVSQSGETADTLVAIENAKEKGAIILGIVNVVGSSIARVSHAGAYTHAGPEIGVASTKAFTAQLAVLTMVALKIGYAKGTLSIERFQALCKELADIPEKVELVLQQNDAIKALAEKYKDARGLFVSRTWLQLPGCTGRCIEAKRNNLHTCRRICCRRNEAWSHCIGR